MGRRRLDTVLAMGVLSGPPRPYSQHCEQVLLSAIRLFVGRTTHLRSGPKDAGAVPASLGAGASLKAIAQKPELR